MSMRVARCFCLDLEIVFSFRIEHSAPVAGAGWHGVTVRVRQIQNFRLLYHFTFSRFTFRTKLGILIRCDVDWLKKEVLCYALHYHVFVWRLEYPLLNPYRHRLSLCRNLLHCHRLVPHLEALFVEVRVYQGDSKLWCGGAQVEKSS